MACIPFAQSAQKFAIIKGSRGAGHLGWLSATLRAQPTFESRVAATFGLSQNFGTNTMKRTYQPSKIRRARTHGFLARMKTRGGRAVINARLAKGRKRLAV